MPALPNILDDLLSCLGVIQGTQGLWRTLALRRFSILSDTAGEFVSPSTEACFVASRTNAGRRVFALGCSVSQAERRPHCSAVAVKVCCRWMFA